MNIAIVGAILLPFLTSWLYPQLLAMISRYGDSTITRITRSRSPPQYLQKYPHLGVQTKKFFNNVSFAAQRCTSSTSCCPISTDKAVLWLTETVFIW